VLSPTRPRERLEIDEQVDVRRYLDAIRRQVLLIALVAVIITGVTVAISSQQTTTYSASARIVVQDPTSTIFTTDPGSIERQLATIRALMTTPAVLTRAAADLPAGESPFGTVDTRVDPNANIISVIATDDTSEGAAAIANAVARAFIQTQRGAEQQRLARARANIRNEIDQLRVSSSANVERQIDALQEQLAAIAVTEANAGAEFRVIELASAGSPSSSHPLRNGVLAFIASLFLGVLVALGRDQLAPRIASRRELVRVVGLPLLASIPKTRRVGPPPYVMQPHEYDAYNALQVALEFKLAPRSEHILLITSAVHSEGKSSVTALLGWVLARSGKKTLLVSADMRRPRLHEIVGMRKSPGLSQILAGLDQEDTDYDVQSNLSQLIWPVSSTNARATLHVLPSGNTSGRTVLSPSTASAFFDALRELDYDYVLVDSPPLLGVIDSQILARYVDGVLVVSRLDSLTMDNAIELRDTIERVECKPLGLVVTRVSPDEFEYYG